METNGGGKSLRSIVLRLMWTSAIYFIWKERNSRLFRKNHVTAVGLLRFILSTIRGRIEGMHHIKDNAANRSILSAFDMNYMLDDFSS